MSPDSVKPPPVPPRSSPGIYRTMIFLLGTVIALLVLYRATEESAQPPDFRTKLPRMWVVPPFALTERSGKTITNRDLYGKVWVADFIYTTCPGPCPLVTANMATVEKALANDPNLQFVTLTVDPQTDTPGVLAQYADKYGADPNRWWFLTGPEKQIDDLILNGFKEAVQDNRGKETEPGQFTVTHSTQFALVDADGNVRGFYDEATPSDNADLLRDIKALEKEAGK
jgi:protein SCO1